MSGYLNCVSRSLALSSALCLFGCGHSSTAISKHEEKAQTDAVPHLRYADDVARFISGLSGPEGSPFKDLEMTEAWKEHHRFLDAAWGKAEAGLIQGLQQFQEKELNDSSLRAVSVFYPFGGPDALTPTLCFPKSASFVMVGLEPPGTLPAPPQFKRKELPRYLAEMRNAVSSELSRSFFVTRQMDREFRGQVTDGLLLPILHLLARTHNTILGFRYIRLDDQGRVIDRAADYKAPGRFGNKGVEIEFRSSDLTLHKLYYFSVNLANDRLAENGPFLTYLSRMKGATTLLKATSYMPHRAEFSLIRDQILAVSGAILQDDSGIPYQDFQHGNWDIQLYGEYRRPYGSFRWLEQPELRKAYEAGAKPMTLRVGYGYSKIASNLLLARQSNRVAAALHQDSPSESKPRNRYR